MRSCIGRALRPSPRLAACGLLVLLGGSMVAPSAARAADVGLHHARAEAGVAGRTVRVAADSERVDDDSTGAASIRLRVSNDAPLVGAEDDQGVHFRCESTLQQALCFAIEGETSAPPPAIPAP